MSESDVVTVRGLRKSYGDRLVVDGLDLDVRAGQVVGLIGANGAGKTRPLPLTMLTNAVRQPWLGIGSATGSLVTIAVLTLAATVIAARRTAL